MVQVIVQEVGDGPSQGLYIDLLVERDLYRRAAVGLIADVEKLAAENAALKAELDRLRPTEPEPEPERDDPDA